MDNAKRERLEWALKYQNFDFSKVLFTNESLFEASTLRSSHAKGVLRRAGELFLPQNLDRKFPKGTATMFWGGIMAGYDGSQPPCHFFPSPVETPAQRHALVERLEQEFHTDTDDYNYFTGLGEEHTIPVHKIRITRGKGGLTGIYIENRFFAQKSFPFYFDR